MPQLIFSYSSFSLCSSYPFDYSTLLEVLSLLAVFFPALSCCCPWSWSPLFLLIILFFSHTLIFLLSSLLLFSLIHFKTLLAFHNPLIHFVLYIPMISTQSFLLFSFLKLFVLSSSFSQLPLFAGCSPSPWSFCSPLFYGSEMSFLLSKYFHFSQALVSWIPMFFLLFILNTYLFFLFALLFALLSLLISFTILLRSSDLPWSLFSLHLPCSALFLSSSC